jgi:hypothetical protein
VLGGGGRLVWEGDDVVTDGAGGEDGHFQDVEDVEGR